MGVRPSFSGLCVHFVGPGDWFSGLVRLEFGFSNGPQIGLVEVMCDPQRSGYQNCLLSKSI